MFYKQNNNDEIYLVFKILIKILYGVAAIAPFLLTLINTGAYLFTYSYAKQFLVILFLSAFLLLFLSYLCIKKMPEEEGKNQEIYVLIILAVMAFLLRVMAMLLMKSQPVSDFFMAYDNATKLVNGIIDPFYQIRYGAYPYWGCYSITLAFVFKIFTPSVLVGQIFNCVIETLTTMIIYLTAKKIMNSYKIGIIAAVLFMINPTIIIYNSVLSGEHLIMLFSCAIIYLLADCFCLPRIKSNMKKIVLDYILIGIFIGLIGTYKPIHIIFLIALFIFEMIFSIFKDVKERKKVENNVFFKKMMIEIALLFLVIITNKTITTVNQKILDNIMDINRDEVFQAHKGYGLPILAGLVIDENGNWVPNEARNFRDTYTGEKEDFSAACFQEAKKYVKKYYDKYPTLFWNKFTTTWGRYRRYPESAFIEWSFYPTATLYQADSGQHPITASYYAEVSTLLGQYYFIWILFAFFGVASMVKGSINKGLFYCVLVVFGFVLMTCIAEAQMRYRSIFFPYISILSAVGVNYIVTKFSCLVHCIKQLLHIC